MRGTCRSPWPVQSLCAFWLFLGSLACSAGPDDYFKIQVLDEVTGRGVPLVELRTVNKASCWTDSNGIVAFNEPGLMDIEVYFHVASPGYEVPVDFFRNRGVKLKPVRGGHAEIRLKRLNIAERLYRITDLSSYEAFTCIAGNGKFRGKETELDRDALGRLRYRWRASADRLSPGRVRDLISAGKMRPVESWIDLIDFETGDRFPAGRGSVYWNDFRRHWVMLNSLSKAGEIWFAEADTPIHSGSSCYWSNAGGRMARERHFNQGDMVGCASRLNAS